MSFWKVIRPTNRRARVLVGLLLAALFCIQCTRTTEAVHDSRFLQVLNGKTAGSNSAGVLEQVGKLAETDHAALFDFCLKHYAEAYRDYTCTFVKQERIAGKVGQEQWISVKFLESPYSVAMHWTKNAPTGDALLYIEGKYDNRMMVRPANPFVRSLVGGSVLRVPNDPDAMQNTLRPVNLFGFRRSMESLREVYVQARKAGDLQESCGGYAKVDGRETIVLIRQLPARKDYPAAKTVTYLDLEYLVPIMLEAYDWDGKLDSRYIFKDVKFNANLTSEDFLPKTNEIEPPK